MTKKTLSRCLTTIGMLAFAISMALPAAALEDRALPTYPCPKCGTTMTTSVETGYEFFTTPCIHGNVNAEIKNALRLVIPMQIARNAERVR